MSKSDFYYTIYSSTSANSMSGLQPRVSLMTGKEIYDLALEELLREGFSFESMAGVPIEEDEDGDAHYERLIDDDEELFRLSVQKLGDDGRLFEAFLSLDADECVRFIERAARYGLEGEAAALVDE